jgi:hypothetical protein
VTVRLLILTALLSSAAVYAQEPTINVPLARAMQIAEVPQPPDPPAGPAAWSLTIHTTGGFTGQGIGSVTMSSDGTLACAAGGSCARQVAVSQLRQVSTALASIVDAAWIRKTPSGLCRDCVQTTVVLRRREGDVVRTFVASWDDSESTTSELRELRRVVFELRATGRR